MSTRDRTYWDSVYRDALAVMESYPAPDPLLFMYSPPPTLKAGSEPPNALDLACGLGQNGLWLAEQGYITDLIDISRTALIAAREEASARGLRSVNLLQLDLDDAHGKLIPFNYDLVCMFRYFNRELIAPLRASIKPGGRIICETWNVNMLDTDLHVSRDQLVEIGELSGIFADWQLLRHTDNGIISQVVAIKPGTPF